MLSRQQLKQRRPAEKNTKKKEDNNKSQKQKRQYLAKDLGDIPAYPAALGQFRLFLDKHDYRIRIQRLPWVASKRCSWPKVVPMNVARRGLGRLEKARSL